jgi:hypothetical protein
MTTSRLIEMSDEFQAGYFEGFHDAADAVLREWHNSKGIPYDLVDEYIAHEADDCLDAERSNDERFSHIMAEYHRLLPEDLMLRDGSEDDFEWGVRVGSEDGLLETILYGMEKDFADLNSDSVLGMFARRYLLGCRAVTDMYRALERQIDEARNKTETDESKIIPFTKREKPTL